MKWHQLLIGQVVEVVLVTRSTHFAGLHARHVGIDHQCAETKRDIGIGTFGRGNQVEEPAILRGEIDRIGGCGAYRFPGDADGGRRTGRNRFPR